MTAAGAEPKDTPGQLAIRPDWLARRTEDIVDPGLAIIDPHHHIWDPPGARYLFDEFLADVRSGHDLRASVFIECHSMYRARGPEELRPVGETEFVAGVAAQSDSGRYGPARLCAAIVSYVDYSLGDRFESVIDAHSAAAGGRLRGFRGRSSSHADREINKWATPPGVLVAAASRSAIAAMARRNLSLDVWAYQTQIDEVVELARAFPTLTVVIDHAAGPLGCDPYRERRAEMFSHWAAGVAALAELPNTVMKISGLGMRFSGFDFYRNPLPPSSDELVAAWRPYVDACIDGFGPDRCMFASNFPADKATCGYAVLWNAFKKLSRGLTAGERSALFHDTARRVYRLPED